MSQQIPSAKQARVAGVFAAANFAYGSNPLIEGGVLLSGNTTTGAGSVIVVRSPQPFLPASVTLPDGASLDPYNVNAPITINDATPETVTPTAVSINSDGTVSITANLSHTHGQGAVISSGSVGLQEAINAANAAGGGVVAIDAAWAGFGGTQAILLAATLVAGVHILDNRGASGPIVVLSGATDAVPINAGTAIVTTNGVDAMTLATPAAGTNDGLELTVISTGAHAHTVTTAANKINGADDTATFGAAAGNGFTFVAYGGIWYAKNLTGVTLSEV